MQIETDYVLDEIDLDRAVKNYLENQTNIPREKIASVYFSKSVRDGVDKFTARIRLVNEEVTI